MKRFKILLPLLTITTPLISMVSCKDDKVENVKLDIECQNEHIKIKKQPDETLINHTIVIEYSVDADYIEDVIIKRGIDTITYDCLINKETKVITIPSEQVTADITILLNANPSYQWVFDKTNHAATLKKYYGIESDITIPQVIESEGVTYTVTTIGEGAFGSSSNAVKITLPNTVTKIEQWGCNGAKKLVSIYPTTNLVEIGSNAFQGSSITGLALENIVTLASGALCYCNKLTSISISSLDLTDLPSSLFNGCSKLAVVTLPSSIKNLSLGLFSNCTSLGAIYCQGLTKTQWMALQRPEYGSWHTNVPETCQVFLSDGNYPINDVN